VGSSFEYTLAHTIRNSAYNKYPKGYQRHVFEITEARTYVLLLFLFLGLNFEPKTHLPASTLA
jgi:hypothetical protein